MRMKKKIKAVIFDMDGVIIDASMFHAKIIASILAEKGIKIPPEKISVEGKMTKVIFEEIFRQYGGDFRVEDLVEEKKKRTFAAAKNNVKEISGTRKFIDKISKLGLPMAIGTAGMPEITSLFLNELGLKEKFAVIATVYETKNGKPEPDVFLLAAKKLKVAPKFCLVVEDAVIGMVAANRAGMQCIGLIKNGGKEKYPADLLVASLTDEIIFKTFEFTKNKQN